MFVVEKFLILGTHCTKLYVIFQTSEFISRFVLLRGCCIFQKLLPKRRWSRTSVSSC